MNDSETATRILDVAQALAQERGYHGFSYRDLSQQIGIKTSSIHYHFPSKADLGRALVARYLATFQAAFVHIDASERDQRVKLKHYRDIFSRTLGDGGKMCLCGMLATDAQTLPPAVSAEVRRFVLENEAWIARVLEEGQRAGLFRATIEPRLEAGTLFAALEGAMLFARALNDGPRFTHMSDLLLKALEA